MYLLNETSQIIERKVNPSCSLLQFIFIQSNKTRIASTTKYFRLVQLVITEQNKHELIVAQILPPKFIIHNITAKAGLKISRPTTRLQFRATLRPYSHN